MRMSFGPGFPPRVARKCHSWGDGCLLGLDGAPGYAGGVTTTGERVKQYHDAMREVLEPGVRPTARNGTGAV